MFHTASGGGIRSGTTADISFERAQKILKTLENTSHVTMDVPTTHLPRGCSLAILSTAKEVTALCEGTPVDVEAYVEWTISCPQEPVMTLNGGFARTLCAARTGRRLAGEPFSAFGARPMLRPPEEVRWGPHLQAFEHVTLFVSGG